MFEVNKERLEKLRENMHLLRQIAGYSDTNFGKLLGCSRQTISNIESRNSRLSIMQYLAIDRVFEELRKENKLLDHAVCILLDSEEISEQEKEWFTNDIYAAIGKFGRCNRHKTPMDLSLYLQEQFKEVTQNAKEVY